MCAHYRGGNCLNFGIFGFDCIAIIHANVPAEEPLPQPVLVPRFLLCKIQDHPDRKEVYKV